MSIFGPPNIKDLQKRRDVNGLFKALNYQKDVHTRELAAAALGEIGITLAVDPLAAAVRDPSDIVRKAAVSALGRIGDEHAVDVLIGLLRDRDKEIREGALLALGNLNAVCKVEPLIEMLDTIYYYVQIAAIKRLGDFHDVRIIEPLIQLAGGTRWDYKLRDEIQTLVKKALEQVCDESKVDMLTAMSKNSDPEVSSTAFELLAKIGNKPAMETLFSALKNESYGVRVNVAFVLEKSGWKPDESENGAYYWASRRKWDKCIEIGAPAVAPLKFAFEHSSHGERFGIANALVQLDWQPDNSEMLAYYWASKHQWDKCVEIGQPAIEPLSYSLENLSLPFRQRFLIARALKELGKDVYFGSIKEFPQIYEQIILILDSQKDSEKKRMQIQSFLEHQWNSIIRSYEKIEFCECGYPIVGVFKDGSRGPINDIVYFEKDGSYTSKYYCPCCDHYIKTITQ